MKEFIDSLESGEDLGGEAVSRAVEGLVSLEVREADKVRFLKALRVKGETAGEIAGFVKAFLERAVDPGLEVSRLLGPMIDVCGTGGDRQDLFNVSTTVMFVLAAAGATVVKHGNRAITSQCGGADVLEELGVSIELAPRDFRRCVEAHGVGFLFAPAYHPAFRVIGPVRRALAAEGIPTIFNLLGPLLNPARPRYQLVGVFAEEILPKYGEALGLLDRERVWAVHGNGMDELSLGGTSAVCEVVGGERKYFRIDAGDWGLEACAVEELKGGDRGKNAAILTGILGGTVGGGCRDLVLLNAAAGLVITGIAADLGSGLERARAELDSGRALGKLRELQAFV